MIENVLILANAGLAATAEVTIAELLKGRDECPQALVGPVVWKPGPTGRQWYFVFASADRVFRHQ